MINLFCDNDSCMGKAPLDMTICGEEIIIKCSKCGDEVKLLGTQKESSGKVKG